MENEVIKPSNVKMTMTAQGLKGFGSKGFEKILYRAVVLFQNVSKVII